MFPSTFQFRFTEEGTQMASRPRDARCPEPQRGGARAARLRGDARGPRRNREEVPAAPAPGGRRETGDGPAAQPTREHCQMHEGVKDQHPRTLKQ